jgi:acetolactate synthase-1/2/3 large subunit
VRVAAEENCFPMIPAGHGHDEVLLAGGRRFRDAAATAGG